MAWARRIGIASGGMFGIGGAGVAALVGYAQLTAESKLYFPDTPAPDLQASADPEVIARGKYLVHGPAHCAQCHSTGDREHPEKIRTSPLSGGLAFEMGPMATTWGRNLTPDPETGIGRRTDAELARTIRTGVLPDGNLSIFMRYSIAELSDEDLVAVISYLRSVEPVKNEVPEGEWYLLGRLVVTYAFPDMKPRALEGPEHVPPSDEPSVERGEYLVEHVMVCAGCHTQFDMATFEPNGPKLGGSLTAEPSHGKDSDMEFAAPNLTSHPTGITGKLDEDAFVARMKAGRAYASSIMPWENFQDTTEADLRSVYRYIRTVPPVDQDVGPSYRKIGWTPDGGS
jgi:mono/diheme cytochrome c family protein